MSYIRLLHLKKKNTSSSWLGVALCSSQGVQMNPLTCHIYIYILTFFYSLKKKNFFEHPSPKFYLNPTKINLNMIILMLLLQYFYNKCYMASYNWFLFRPIINITFYLPLTTYHLDFVIKFLWKYCVLNIIKKKKVSFLLIC